jgi:hypothetical protein
MLDQLLALKAEVRNHVMVVALDDLMEQDAVGARILLTSVRDDASVNDIAERLAEEGRQIEVPNVGERRSRALERYWRLIERELECRRNASLWLQRVVETLAECAAAGTPRPSRMPTSPSKTRC